jgi:hypothetical protein
VRFNTEVVELVEAKVKERYSLGGFTLKEFSLKASGAVVKMENSDGVEIAVKVPSAIISEFEYEALVEQGKLDQTKVSLYEYVELFQQGVPVEQMAEVLARKEAN